MWVWVWCGVYDSSVRHTYLTHYPSPHIAHVAPGDTDIPESSLGELPSTLLPLFLVHSVFNVVVCK